MELKTRHPSDILHPHKLVRSRHRPATPHSSAGDVPVVRALRCLTVPGGEAEGQGQDPALEAWLRSLRLILVILSRVMGPVGPPHPEDWEQFVASGCSADGGFRGGSLELGMLPREVFTTKDVCCSYVIQYLIKH